MKTQFFTRWGNGGMSVKKEREKEGRAELEYYFTILGFEVQSVSQSVSPCRVRLSSKTPGRAIFPSAHLTLSTQGIIPPQFGDLRSLSLSLGALDSLTSLWGNEVG